MLHEPYDYIDLWLLEQPSLPFEVGSLSESEWVSCLPNAVDHETVYATNNKPGCPMDEDWTASLIDDFGQPTGPTREYPNRCLCVVKTDGLVRPKTQLSEWARHQCHERHIDQPCCRHVCGVLPVSTANNGQDVGNCAGYSHMPRHRSLHDPNHLCDHRQWS